MFQGNWKCSKCGGAITQLPFQPRSEAGLTCRTCYSSGGGGNSSSSNRPATEQAVPEMAGASEAPDIPDFAEVAGEPAPFEDYGEATLPPVVAEKPRFEGKWKCATCDGDITSLPFAPRDVTNLKCIDCFKKSKQ